jgi:hypothetical protein
LTDGVDAVSGAVVSVFRLSKLVAEIDISVAGLAGIVEICLRVKKWLSDPYRPELHYMRGPGPKWREKHGNTGSIRSKSPDIDNGVTVELAAGHWGQT